MDSAHIGSIAANGSSAIPLAGKMPAVALLFFGVLALYLVGFSAMPSAHNATHDTRHATGFPCH